MTTTTNYHKEKYYCQICARQCQDKDGFNCHMKSKTHAISMQRIAEQPELYIKAYSDDFEKGYLDIMRRGYENKWVSANRVYEEYKRDKESVQLTMTKWETLTKFIQYLVNEKKCSINPSDNDILVRYIDNSGIILKEKGKREEKEKDEKDMDEIKKYKVIKQEKKDYVKANIDQMKGMKIMLGSDDNEKMLNNKRERDEDKGDENNVDAEEEEEEDEDEDIIWIRQGMIVRIEDKELDNGSYYKMKGKIINTKEYIAEIELPKINKKITIDQYYLSKTTPSIGSLSIITSGPHQNLIGIITNIPKSNSFTFQPSNSSLRPLLISSSSLCKFKK